MVAFAEILWHEVNRGHSFADWREYPDLVSLTKLRLPPLASKLPHHGTHARLGARVWITGGYRRTPVMQVGADIYRDTQLILRALGRLHP